MKTAVVVFVSTPLLGQAGLSIETDPEKALRIYSMYIEELLSQFSSEPTMDILFCCEEKFQAIMVSNHFARIKNCLVYSGTWGQRMSHITHYCGNYRDYDYIFICPQEFTMISPTTITSFVQKLQRTKRSVLIVSHNQQTLDIIGLNFPFQTIYQDIIWQKDDVVSQIKTNLHNQSIPCILLTDEVVLETKNQHIDQVLSAFPRTQALLKN